MKYDADRIRNNIKGSMAETIFELIHLELGCQVYRTGQEFLYPNLFQIANTKKRLAHQILVDEDIKSFKEKFGATDEIAHRSVIYERFRKSLLPTLLSSNPDFTIIDRYGNIHQYEVKFRTNGKLSEEQTKKYLRKEYPPEIFIVMPKYPYFRLMRTLMREWVNHTDESKKMGIALMKKDKKLYDEASLELDEKIRSQEKKYMYVDRDEKTGDIRIDQVITSEHFTYPNELLDRFGKVVEDLFKQKAT